MTVVPSSPRRRAASSIFPGGSVVVLLAGIAGGFLAGMNYPPRTAAPAEGALVGNRVRGGGLGSGGGGDGSEVSTGSSSSVARLEATAEDNPKEGWKVVHVFYGTPDHLPSASEGVSPLADCTSNHPTRRRSGWPITPATWR